jgi:hypothetical protein
MGCCWDEDAGRCFIPANVPAGDSWATRPVEVKVSPDGRLFFTSDNTGEIIVLSSSRAFVADDDDSDSLSDGAIAGIVIGCVAGVGLIGAAVAATKRTDDASGYNEAL